jgi:hypothetical protein
MYLTDALYILEMKLCRNDMKVEARALKSFDAPPRDAERESRQGHTVNASRVVWAAGRINRSPRHFSTRHHLHFDHHHRLITRQLPHHSAVINGPHQANRSQVHWRSVNMCPLLNTCSLCLCLQERLPVNSSPPNLLVRLPP